MQLLISLGFGIKPSTEAVNWQDFSEKKMHRWEVSLLKLSVLGQKKKQWPTIKHRVVLTRLLLRHEVKMAADIGQDLFYTLMHRYP